MGKIFFPLGFTKKEKPAAAKVRKGTATVAVEHDVQRRTVPNMVIPAG